MKIDINTLKIDFSDFIAMVRKYKSRILLTSLAFGVLGGSYAFLKKPDYYAEASFKEKRKSVLETSKNLNLAFLLGENEKNESSAQSLMKSRKLLQKVIYQQGLQGVLESQGTFHFLSSIRHNFLTELAYLNSNFYPEIGERIRLMARNLEYTGERPLSLALEFVSKDDYILYDPSSKELGRGTIGSLFRGEGFSFILLSNSNYNLTGKHWKLILLPLTQVVDSIRKVLKIRTDPEDKSILLLSYRNTDRDVAANFLNSLMTTYVNYLKEENTRSTQEQLNYLRRRKEEIASDLKNIMEEHAEAISSHATSIEFLAKLQESYTQRALVINLELKRLNNALSAEPTSYEPFFNESDSTVIHRLISDVRACKEQVCAIQADLKTKPSKEPTPKPAEFQGIDLDMANQLYLDYSQQLNEMEVNSVHYQFIISQIQDPQFEISTLSSVLNDTVSHNIINKAVELDLKKLDQANRSQKEIDRLKEDLALQRQYLRYHVEQNLQLLSIKQKIVFDKLAALQQIKMELLDQRVLVLNQHLTHYIKDRIENNLQEKSSLEHQQKTVKSRMEEMPTQWASNKLIDLHLEMSTKMVEEITKLVESKNISSHIDLNQSAPLDISIAPLLPTNPHIILFTLLGAFCGGLLSLAFSLPKGIFRDTELSINLLKQLNVSAIGPISTFDQETLFRIIGWLNTRTTPSNKGKTAFLFLNQGYDYSNALIAEMSKNGSKVILIEFGKEEDVTNAEINKEYKIEKKNGYDYLLLKGRPNASIFTTSFQKYLETLKEQYAWVMIAFQTPPCSEESTDLYPFCDCAILSLQHETLQQLTATLNSTDCDPHKLLAII